MLAAGFLSVLMAMPFVPFGATAVPTTAREDVEAMLAASGGSWSDLTGYAEIVDVDAKSGVETRRIVPIEEALVLIEDLRPPPATQNPDSTAHVVAGGLAHSCTHSQRACYRYEIVRDTNAKLVGDSSGPVRDVKNAYVANAAAVAGPWPNQPPYSTAKAHYTTQVASIAAINPGAAAMLPPWPFAYSTVLHVNGDYGSPGSGSGSHAANNTAGGRPSIDTGQTGLLGVGAGHSDKDLHGYGVGSLRMILVPWGPGLVISYGRLNVHGAFAFCNVSNADQCQNATETAAEFGL